MTNFRIVRIEFSHDQKISTERLSSMSDNRLRTKIEKYSLGRFRFVKISMKISRDRDKISDLIIRSILVDVMYIERLGDEFPRLFFVKKTIVHKIIDYIFRISHVLRCPREFPARQK